MAVTRKSTAFTEALRHLQSSEKLQVVQLYGLSVISVADFESFKQVWPTLADARRRKLMHRLVELAETNFEVDFTPIFLQGLTDEDGRVRAKAVEGLWEVEDQALVGPLTHLLRADPLVEVRAVAATALGQYILLGELEEIDGAPAHLAEQAILEAIRDPNEEVEVCRRAIEAIGYSGGAGVRNLLEAAYYDEDQRMQVSAIFAMGRSADRIWIPILIQELENRDSEIRFQAARSCGELEAQEAVPKLINLIEIEADYEVQTVAIWSLGRIGGALAQEALETLAAGDDKVLREAAEEALEEINVWAGLSLPLYDFDDEDDDDLLPGLAFDEDLNGRLN
jgi:HEAT repeat protein